MEPVQQVGYGAASRLSVNGGFGAHCRWGRCSRSRAHTAREVNSSVRQHYSCSGAASISPAASKSGWVSMAVAHTSIVAPAINLANMTQARLKYGFAL